MTQIKLEFSTQISTHSPSRSCSYFSQMALDGKAIKEEIPEKEVYDSGSVRRAKGEFVVVSDIECESQ